MTEWTPQWQWAADYFKPWCRQQRKIDHRALTFKSLARRTLTSWKIWGAVVTPTARPVATAQRYAGARLCLHLNTNTQSLYWILSWIRSQWRSISIGVICSDFLAKQTSLAAALLTAWSRFRRFAGRPAIALSCNSSASSAQDWSRWWPAT